MTRLEITLACLKTSDKRGVHVHCYPYKNPSPREKILIILNRVVIIDQYCWLFIAAV